MGQINLAFLAEFIGNVGFPIFIAIYFVYHQDRRLKEIDRKLEHLNTLVALLLVSSDPESAEIYRKVIEPNEGEGE